MTESEINIQILKLRNYLSNGNIAKNLQQKLQLITKTYQDALTGLYNTAYMQKYCEKVSHNKSFIYIDISEFKKTNDTYGHHI
jgi:GGDEF domain-containing protein